MADKSVGLLDKTPDKFPDVCLGILALGNKITPNLDVGAK